jgi:HSP20 family protein
MKSIIPWKKEDRPLARRRDVDDPFDLLQRRMNSVFDDFIGRSPSELWSGFGDNFAPQTDVSETEKEVRISAELPGLEEKDLDVTLSGDLLTIKGEKKEEQNEEKGDCWHHERSYGYFERTVQLPQAVDTDKASAKFKNGVLNVTIPKKPGAQSARKRIELTAG